MYHGLQGLDKQSPTVYEHNEVAVVGSSVRPSTGGEPKVILPHRCGRSTWGRAVCSLYRQIRPPHPYCVYFPGILPPPLASYVQALMFPLCVLALFRH